MSSSPSSSSSPRRRRRSQEDEQVVVPFQDADVDGELLLKELDEFVIPGSDDKGRKVTVTFNIHPNLDRQLDVILGSKRFPYANKKDLLRHAAARHCAWLCQIRKTVPVHYMSMFEADIELIREDEAGMKMERVFLALEDRVNEHVGRGEQGESLRLISQIHQHLLRLKPSMWMRKFGERFFTKYGVWLRSTKGPPDEDEE
jgi:hypothetical protein